MSEKNLSTPQESQPPLETESSSQEKSNKKTKESSSKPTSSPRSKAKPRSSVRFLSEEDLDCVVNALHAVEDSSYLNDLTQRLSSDKGFSTKLTSKAHNIDLGILYATMDIVNKWKPEIDEHGNVVAQQEGNIDDPSALDADALVLSALNVNLSALKGHLEASVDNLTTDRDMLESRMRNAMRDERRKGLLSNPTDKELTDVSVSHEKYLEATQILFSLRELKEVVTSIHFAVRRLEDRLSSRSRALCSSWGRAVYS